MNLLLTLGPLCAVSEAEFIRCRLLAVLIIIHSWLNVLKTPGVPPGMYSTIETFMFLLISLWLCVSDVTIHNTSTRLISTGINPLLFKASTCLYAEPLKKKKRIDPAIIKQREERKKKRLEKQIRRLEKNARQLKPIDELEVPLEFTDGNKERTREVAAMTPQTEEERAILHKEWARYKNKQHVKDLQMIDRLIFAQQKALDELRQESEELYEAAIQINPTQIPFTVHGPVQTPPIKGYDSPDGEYTDVSKKW